MACPQLYVSHPGDFVCPRIFFRGNGVNIRPATEDDLDQVCALAEEIATFHHSKEPEVFARAEAQRDRAFWLSCITSTEGTVLVASDAETIVGYVTAKVSNINAPTFLNPRIVCRVGTIVVSSHVQRRGIGRELIRSIETWAISRSAVEIRLEVFAFNLRASSFYTSLGYRAQSYIMSRGLS